MPTQSLLKTAVVASFLLPSVMVSPQSALAAQQDFTVHNQTGATLVGLWVSDSGRDVWGRNLLSRPLPSSGSTFVWFDENTTSCLFDIKATFSDSSSTEDYQIDLCSVSDYTIYE